MSTSLLLSYHHHLATPPSAISPHPSLPSFTTLSTTPAHAPHERWPRPPHPPPAAPVRPPPRSRLLAHRCRPPQHREILTPPSSHRYLAHLSTRHPRTARLPRTLCQGYSRATLCRVRGRSPLEGREGPLEAPRYPRPRFLRRRPRSRLARNYQPC